jgi:hypothetical protein
MGTESWARPSGFLLEKKGKINYSRALRADRVRRLLAEASAPLARVLLNRFFGNAILLKIKRQ